jgi:predicted HAD superfamily Cof-like phosphohydrolase
MSILKKIVDWNNERGLIEKGFNHKNEISFIIEELLESTGKYDSITAREESIRIAETITNNEDVNKEEIVDAFADIIVFATGAIAKVGYDPDKVMNEVFKEIDSRKGKMIDGKFVKDLDVEMYKSDFSICKK